MTGRRTEQLETEVESLRARLEEAEETLSAIRDGEVDAVVVHDRRGDRVYTFRNPSRPWRLMIEEMRQGAVTATLSGTVLWCNAAFARTVHRPAEALVGVSITSYVAPESRELLEALLLRAGEGEIELLAGDGTRVPSYIAVNALPLEDEPVLCLVITDLTEQKRNEQIVADERLARSILVHAAVPMVVCDPAGRIVRASGEAHRLCGRNLLLEPFATAFPLELADPEVPDVGCFLSRALQGQRIRGLEAVLERPDCRLDLMISAGPLWGPNDQLEGCVVTLTDITTRRRVERELERAWEAAEEMNRAKDRFLATLSHELRTPLTPVLMVLSSLQARGGLPADTARELAMMRRNIELEARLIDDLLDLTRISRGKVDLQYTVADLRQVVEHAIATSCGEAREAGRISVVFETGETGDGDWRLWADASRLTQVFWNLLNNAVKFTSEGGTIRVRLWREEAPAWLAVEVSDNGVGIDPDLLPRIFNAFEQGEPGLSRRSGLGLGLTISKAIVELHGGEVGVRSQGRDQGATLTVRLPAGLPAEAVASPRSGQGKELVAEPGRPRHILLVEDHADTAEALADLLVLRGYRVSQAGSLAEAMALADALADDAEGIDFVLSDLGLPDGSGLDLMRELSRRYGLTGIALSGYGMEEDVRKSREAGFRRHLTKPVDAQALEEAIRR